MSTTVKKSPYPFDRIAVAVAFSPRIEAILAAAKRLHDTFNATLYFIHVGDHDIKQEQYLKHMLHRFGLDAPANEIIWETGDPVEKILDVCKDKNIDLLVAGALEKESLLKYFMGSVARNLSRKAKCSILMLREPEIKLKTISRIVVEGSDHPKTVNTIETAVYVAKQMQAHEVCVVQEQDAGKMALIRSQELTDNETDEHREKIERDEKERLDEILRCAGCGDLRVVTERLEGKPGFVISNFAREHNADLLVLNSPDTKLNLLDRVFPHDIEYALADLPCDLLIVHSRITNDSEAE
ncbi:MAG: universal stress protein [Bacteroidota bacterium]|jgi:nucleotide-binding universal stress UspA family protein